MADSKVLMSGDIEVKVDEDGGVSFKCTGGGRDKELTEIFYEAIEELSATLKIKIREWADEENN